MQEIGSARNVILLTGAGFTKNFGGFLADEMWSHIFNDPLVQESTLLRAALQDNFDFESVYSSVIDNEHIALEEKEAMKKAVSGAYQKLDDAIKGWVFNDRSPYPVNVYGLGKLTNLFSSSNGEQGYFFTLNQDLFMERKFGNMSPAVPRFPDGFYHKLQDIDSADFVTLPAEDIENRVKKGIQDHAGFAYIKLHGSYGWKSASGSDQMVIGKNKIGSIGNEPLLKCYFDLFESVIKQGSKKIVILGYGFQDQHINNVLLNGVQNHDLKIVIVGQKPRSVKERIERNPSDVKGILGGITAYIPYELKEIFPSNQEITVHFKEIEKALLN